MTRLLVTLIFILTFFAVKAQKKDKTLFVGNVISDTTSCKTNYRSNALTPILKSKNKIEIRLITYPSFSYTNYTILTYNNKWTAQYYYYDQSKDTILSKDISKKANLDTIFSRLVYNNIFSLPDQSNLKNEKYYYDLKTDELVGEGMTVCDGVCYKIEFKISNNYRTYHYCNPDSYANFYTSSYELKNFINIVDAFNELTK